MVGCDLPSHSFVLHSVVLELLGHLLDVVGEDVVGEEPGIEDISLIFRR